MKKLWTLCIGLFMITCACIAVNLPPARSYDDHAPDTAAYPVSANQPETEVLADTQGGEGPLFSDIDEDNLALEEDQLFSVRDDNAANRTGRPETAGLAMAAPSQTPGPSSVTPGDQNGDAPLLVNHDNPLDKSYVPEHLVRFKKTGYYLVEECADALTELQSAAAAAGLSLPIKSGYRSYSTQDTLYKKKVAYFKKSYEQTEAEEQAARVVAKPGLSEHQTGLAADVGVLTQSFGGTKEGKWLAENCWKYGFIIRYTKEKVDITGYIYEPWHIRYVGIDHAKVIYENGWCLEEYIANLES